MSCANFEREIALSHEKARQSSLEAYANAVRLYQSIVLELQDVTSQDPAIQGNILGRAAAAKEAVRSYRSAYRTAAAAS
jgi:hypothetical protein